MHLSYILIRVGDGGGGGGGSEMKGGREMHGEEGEV